jgi:hypothetical protein
MRALPASASGSRTLGCARPPARSSPSPGPPARRDQLQESNRPGPCGSGPRCGCKSPASRRRCDGEGSAGRSAVSRDGRRALIARSRDLPCPNHLDPVRERGEYNGRDPAGAASRRDRAAMRRIPYCPTPRPTGDHPHGSAPRKANDRVAEPLQGTAAVARRSPSPSVFPAPDSVPHAGPGRLRRFSRKTNDRLPRASGGDRWLAMRER